MTAPLILGACLPQNPPALHGTTESLLLLGGLGTLFQVPWPLVPVLLILFGVAVLSGDLTGRHLMKK